MMGQQSRLEILVMLLKLSPLFLRVFPAGSEGKASAWNAGDRGSILGWEDPLEKGMATDSSILA